MTVTIGRLARLAGIAALAAACHPDRGPVAPRAPSSADEVTEALAAPGCGADGAIWEGDVDAAALRALAPSGIMRVAMNLGNRNNATRNPITGELSGLGVDMVCRLAQGTHARFVLVPYPGVPQLMAGLIRGEWDVAFTFDATSAPSEVAAAIPHIGVENTYVVRGDAPFQSVADVNAPGVRIAVAQGNSPDIYLRSLGAKLLATLVETPTNLEAQRLLLTGVADAWATGRTGGAAFIASSFPTGRMLPDDFLIANLAIAMPSAAAGEGLQYVDEFVDWAKTSGLVRNGIDRAGLIGNLIPPPPPAEQRIAYLRRHVGRLVTNGALNEGQGNALAVKLDGALEKLAAGESEPAMSKVGAFINQVEAFARAGILSSSQSESLLVIARDVVAQAVV
jgi:polar amino acid transport system substrate-binding protein